MVSLQCHVSSSTTSLQNKPCPHFVWRHHLIKVSQDGSTYWRSPVPRMWWSASGIAGQGAASAVTAWNVATRFGWQLYIIWAFFQLHDRYLYRNGAIALPTLSRQALSSSPLKTHKRKKNTSVLFTANSLLVGLPKCALRRLRAAQNSAARLVSRVSGRTRITPVLKHLHWFPVHLRAEYKLLSIVFRVLNTNTAPIYLRHLLKENNRRTLRSNSSTVKLDVVRTIWETGERALLSAPRHDGIRSLLNYVSVTLWHPFSATSRRTSFSTSLM